MGVYGVGLILNYFLFATADHSADLHIVSLRWIEKEERTCLVIIGFRARRWNHDQSGIFASSQFYKSLKYPVIHTPAASKNQRSRRRPNLLSSSQCKNQGPNREQNCALHHVHHHSTLNDVDKARDAGIVKLGCAHQPDFLSKFSHKRVEILCASMSCNELN